MNLIINRWPQTIIFFVLALLTLLAITFVLLSTFAHVNVLHILSDLGGSLANILVRYP